ncbi:MAG TPA: hypothetical protein VI386_28680 [Candidatus Sulfotelmatobacter sp.]
MRTTNGFFDGTELAGFFRAAGFLMSAGLALVVGFVGPNRDARGHLQRLLTRLAGLLTALVAGLIWTLLADPLYRPTLAGLAIGFGLATIVAFILYQNEFRTAVPQKSALSFYYLALAVSGPIALSSTALLNMLPKPMEVRIVVPMEDTCHVRNSLIEGTWRNLPSDSDLWVSAGTLDGRVLFPEDRKAMKLGNGTWESSFGYEPPSEAKGFYIRVMVLNSEGRAQLERYAQDPARMGLGELPKGVIVGDRVRLRAGGNCSVTK